jgi:hypothetical protein
VSFQETASDRARKGSIRARLISTPKTRAVSPVSPEPRGRLNPDVRPEHPAVAELRERRTDGVQLRVADAITEFVQR